MKPFTKNDFGWVAVLVKPGAEHAAYTEIKRKLGLWPFYPSERVRRRRKAPGQNVTRVFDDELPLFPRYIFARLIDEGDIQAVNDLVHVVGIVKTPGRELPLSIPATVMNELMEKHDQRGWRDQTSREALAHNTRVIFDDTTPFAGLIAFVRKDAGKAVRVWLDQFKREITVDPAVIRAA